MFYFNQDDHGGGINGALENGAPAEPPIFSCSLDEVRQLVCTSAARETLWLGFESFLARMAVGRDFSHLHLLGPFVSKRAEPGGIDAVLQTRAAYGPATFAALQPFFALGLKEIEACYAARLRFWVEGAPRGLRFVRDYGVEGPRRPLARLQELMRHGIVRVELERAGVCA